MRIGELVFGEHQILARNVHVASNKKKIQIILFSSKMHTKAMKPQHITIRGSENSSQNLALSGRYFCPFSLARTYCILHGGYPNDSDPFFIFSDSSNIMPSHVRTVLRKLLHNLGLEDKLYDTHSFCIGCGVDLLEKYLFQWQKFVRQAGGGATSCIDTLLSNINGVFYLIVTLKFLILFLGFVPAYEAIWIIGDRFIGKTFGQYFQQNDSRTFYMKENFDNFPLLQVLEKVRWILSSYPDLGILWLKPSMQGSYCQNTFCLYQNEISSTGQIVQKQRCQSYLTDYWNIFCLKFKG